MTNNLKAELPNVQKNVMLSQYTTFKIGGPAKYFYQAKSREDLVGAITSARQLLIPFVILGRGSNVLVADQGYDGLVIINQYADINIQDDQVIASSGSNLNHLVSACTQRSLSGLEWAAGIPGTLGGAIRGNAGLKDEEIKDVVQSVDCLNTNNQIVQLDNDQCQFAYRTSLFKNSDDWTILEANLRLVKGNQAMIQQKVEENIKIKNDTQPLKLASAGCIFKNPPGDSAGRLIDQTGLKGKRIGSAAVSDIHANFIVNQNGATAEQVVILISLIKQRVRNEFGIQLQEEIEYLGFND